MSQALGNPAGLDGFLVVDKPSGLTSHDVVAAVRRVTQIKKAGHAGTLDPMATGVVVVALARATRLIRYVQDTVKEYVATARFGVATDTLDADGAILTREPMEIASDDVHAVSRRFVGDILQVPPMVSALKVGGRRLYELAREGTEVEREARPVVVHDIEILDVGPPPYPDVEMRVSCGKGTYIRSLADDIAAALGGRAHLTALRRNSVGRFTLDMALTVDELESRWAEMLISPRAGLSDLAAVIVTDDEARAVAHGVRFAYRIAPAVEDDTPFCVVGSDDRLLAVYRNAANGSRADVVIA